MSRFKITRYIESEVPKPVELVKVVHGKWVGVSPMVDSMECSECGYCIFSEELKTPYCPWCGARMIEE